MLEIPRSTSPKPKAGYALDGIWPQIHELDWSDHRPDFRRAYLMALLSELAYEHVTQREIENSGRIKLMDSNLVPCESYVEYLGRENAKAGNIWKKIEAGEEAPAGTGLDKEGSEPGTLVIETENFVTVAMLRQSVAFLSIRGTRLFSREDWDINLLRSLTSVEGLDSSYRFHEGFMNEAITLLGIAVSRLQYSRRAVIATGHSAGAAMACILYYLYSGSTPNSGIRYADRIKVNGAYAFSSPRVANLRVVDDLKRAGMPALYRGKWDPVAAWPSTNDYAGPSQHKLFVPLPHPHSIAGVRKVLAKKAGFNPRMPLAPSDPEHRSEYLARI
jgi:hypothetical protein